MTPGARGWRREGLGVGAARCFDAGLRSDAGLRFGSTAGVRIAVGTAAGVVTTAGVGVAICSTAGRICISARCISDGPGSVQRSGTAAASKHNPKLRTTLSVTPVSILATHYFFVQSWDLDLKGSEKSFFLACIDAGSREFCGLVEVAEPNRPLRCIGPFDRQFEPPLPEPVGRRKHILVAQESDRSRYQKASRRKPP
jgi:hypothetical protein